MSYRIELDETPQDALRRIATEQVAKALGEIDDADLDVHETVHQVRKRCKKIRALVRLVRGAEEDLYAEANATFRDIARTISDARDAAAAIETYDALADAYGEEVMAAYGDIRDALVHRREQGAATSDLESRLAQARGGLDEAQRVIGDWTVDARGFDAFAGGYGKTYGRARKRMEDAYDEATTEAFHEWRKRVKYHRYHVDLLEAIWEQPMEAREGELHDLTDLLGDDHDLAVLRSLLGEVETGVDQEVLGAFVGLLDRRRAGLQQRARPLGRKLFHRDRDDHVDATATVWAAAVEQLEIEPFLEAPLTRPSAV